MLLRVVEADKKYRSCSPDKSQFGGDGNSPVKGKMAVTVLFQHGLTFDDILLTFCTFGDKSVLENRTKLGSYIILW